MLSDAELEELRQLALDEAVPVIDRIHAAVARVEAFLARAERPDDG